jgi:CSLREA domain-containing protein
MRNGLKAALVAAIAALTIAAPAAAKTYEVNKRSDHAPNGCKKKDCTLREAVLAANAHSGPDRIVLPKRKTYNLSIENGVLPDEDAAATGDLDLLDDVAIKHPRKGLAKIDANGIDRVFETGPGGAVSASLAKLTITGGDDPPDLNGGGIYVGDGALKLKRSRVTGNRADGNGGAIYLFNTTTTLLIDRSTISGNVAAGSNGGGLYINGSLAAVRADVNRSTVSGNTATSNGGGIWVGNNATLRVTNSTIDGNRAESNGGGILHAFQADVAMNAVTVTRNRANFNGGGLHTQGTVPFGVENSLIALNAATGVGDDCSQNPGSQFESGGHNLLSSEADCEGFGAAGDLVNSNPKVGQLKKNGGPTQTAALKKGSPAINKAGDSAPNKDQRGEKRGKKPDIGAYERVKKKRKKGRR